MNMIKTVVLKIVKDCWLPILYPCHPRFQRDNETPGNLARSLGRGTGSLRVLRAGEAGGRRGLEGSGAKSLSAPFFHSLSRPCFKVDPPTGPCSLEKGKPIKGYIYTVYIYIIHTLRNVYYILIHNLLHIIYLDVAHVQGLVYGSN